ncbi:MAG: DUF5126 domain-containing protein [Mangrovibacterium sp.]|nr:DUF5126 domain-containing protein [Mangrovibacterium sp.]
MKKLLFIAITILLIWNCSEVKDWSDPKDSVPPGKISEPEYRSLPGGVEITYKLPGDDDILGVKARYSFNEGGEVREAFSSAFRDTIVLEGFPDTLERTSNLVCIDKSLNESEPVPFLIKASTPAVHLIRESLELAPAFGGVFASWKNEYQSDIAVSFYAADAAGEMLLYDTHYSKISKGEFSLRGFDDSERKFRVEIRDRWQQYSVPLDTTLKPLFEEEILPRAETGQMLFSRYGFDDQSTTWRGDYPKDALGNIWRLFDGVGVTISYVWAPGMNYLSNYDARFPKTETAAPMYLTLDLGRVVTLSRHKFWMRSREPVDPYLAPTHRYYQAAAPKYFEIWGSEQPPKQPGDFASKEESLAYWTAWPQVGGTDSWKNDWILLADDANLPLSGAKTADQITVDDCIAADNGIETIMDTEASTKRVRYIRYVFKEQWTKNNTNLHLTELKFFGAEIE